MTELDEHRRTSYELWQRLAPRWEAGRETLWEQSRQVSEWLVEHVDPTPGQTLLDLAAGTGETGFLASPRLGDEGRLICTDFAPEMVAAAKRVAKQLEITNAEFRVLDAERMQLDDSSVDGVVCRWAMMLIADPAQALREVRRVLRPGGRLAFSVWGAPQHNPWITVPGSVMVERGHLPRRDPDEPGMFSLREPDRIASLTTAAGFGQPQIDEMPLLYHFTDSDRLWAFTSELQGPIALAIAALDKPERTAVRSAIEERSAEFASGSGYELPGLSLNVVVT